MSLRTFALAALVSGLFGCSSQNRSISPATDEQRDAGAGADSGGSNDADAGDASAGDAAVGTPPLTLGPINPDAFGKAKLSFLAFAAFSQSNVNARDSQVLSLAPDLVPRAWGQWDTSGLKAADYDFTYPKACQAQGVHFVGGLTASVIFQDEMSAADFADEVGRDAANQPVPHDEIVPKAFRGSLASPGFRERLIEIAKLQIDGGVDGLFFDEVNSGFIGADYQGDEGFDDHQVADFGRFLCAKYGTAGLSPFDLTADDKLDCDVTDPGSSFDYRGYLARHGATAAPLGAGNPLAAAWGTTLQNRPNPSAGSFVETYPALVYFQGIVAQVRAYARSKYGKEVLITANGIFPFVDFQSVGLYDYNHDGPGPKGFDWVPITNGHFTGTATFAPVLADLKTSSARVLASASGSEVPLLLFLDWPTDSIDRYYALPSTERQDYVRGFLAEASAFGMYFAVPLATTTDTQTATALGMMTSFQTLRGFYGSHADLFRGAKAATGTAQSTLASAGVRFVTLPDGRSAVYMINHDYSAGFVAHAGITLTFPLANAPTSVTLASPDLSADTPAQFTYRAGTVSVTIPELDSSLVVVAK